MCEQISLSLILHFSDVFKLMILIRELKSGILAEFTQMCAEWDMKVQAQLLNSFHDVQFCPERRKVFAGYWIRCIAQDVVTGTGK